MLPVVALLAGAGATVFGQRLWKIAAGSCIVAGLVFNLGMIVSGLSGYNHFLADVDAAHEWTTSLTSPEILYLNRNLPPASKVLCVGEAQVFDAEFPLVYNTVFDKSIFQEWTADPRPGVAAGDLPLRNAEDIRTTLRDEGITQVLVNWQEIVRYRMSYGYTDYVAPKRFSELEKCGALAAPLTFASLVLEGLSDEEFATAQRDWKPDFYETDDGRKVFVGSVRRSIGDPKEKDNRTEQTITAWAPSLIARTRAGRILIESQIYPVVP
jgi:hypothetical protein